MKKLVVVAAVLLCGAVMAQSRTVTVREADADAAVVAVRVDFMPDGGCVAMPVVDPRASAVRVELHPRAMRGAACSTVRGVTERAVRLDFGVGDGGVP